MGLGQGEYLTCAPTLLERWEVVLGSPHPEVDGSIVATERQLAAAIAKAEDYVRQTRPHALDLVDLQASWRRRPATEKQLERLKRAHLTPPPRISRGQASHLIAMMRYDARRQTSFPGQFLKTGQRGDGLAGAWARPCRTQP